MNPFFIVVFVFEITEARISPVSLLTKTTLASIGLEEMASTTTPERMPTDIGLTETGRFTRQRSRSPEVFNLSVEKIAKSPSGSTRRLFSLL